MSSFQTYLFGFIILVIGLAVAAHLLGAPAEWIGVGVIIALGIGIISATSRTKTRDHPTTPPRDPNQPGYRDPHQPRY